MEHELIVHSYDWEVSKDEETGYSTINCWGLDRNSDPYLLRFNDFDAFCYVELPLFLNNSYVRWAGFREKLVYDAIRFKLGEDKPHRYMFVRKEKLYFYKGKGPDGKPKTYPMLLLCFHSVEAMKNCKRKLSYPLKIRGLKGGNDYTTVALNVWETHIPLERKLLTLRNCKYSQWFNIKGIKILEEDKISTLENEYIVDWKNLNPIDMEETVTWITHPRILSFDLETYTDRHKSMPDSLCSKHVIYMISVVFQKLMEPETRKTDIILLGDCSDTEMANVIKVKTEIELLEVFQDLIVKYDPEIISGYNIFSYDNPYLENRLKRRMKDWKPLGRIKNGETAMASISWSSSAYKNQDFNILKMNGRISIDLLPVIKRDFKLPLYKLDYVAKHFLNKGKHDVTPKQMFETYELQSCLKPNYEPIVVPKAFSERYKKQNPKTFKNEIDIKKYHEEMIGEWGNQYKTFALDEMKKVVDYCVIDSDLVVDLFDKINVWIGLISLSNIMGIVPSDIFTRGTGVRMQSQIYDEASRDGIVLDEIDFPKTNFIGGYVADPQIGIHHNILIWDFKSLYPSIQISHNMDHHTKVPDHLMNRIPDEDCHVVEWDEEIEEDSEEDNETDEKHVKKKEIKHFKHKFVKEPIGIMPKLLSKLIAERNKVRAKQKLVPKGSLEWNVLEQTQLGIKCSSNAFFGSCGSNFGKLRFPEIACSITAKARESTKKMNSYLESKGHRIIYGDTDSTMADIGITDPKTAWEKGEKVAKELTSMFLKPMEAELEMVFHTMLSIKKKMYLCINMDRDGNPIDDPDKMKIRGVTLARRDNCQFQREFYKNIVWKVMHREPFINTFNFIIDKCIELASHSVKWEDLTMIKGLGSNYKSDSYMMAVFAREMEKAGNPMTPGDRIQYLLADTGNQTDLVGNKMRSVEVFQERAASDNPEHIDYLYYLEKTIRNGIEKQLYQIGYKTELEELEERYKDMGEKKVLKELVKKGHMIVVNNLMGKYNNNKEEVIDYLLEHDQMSKIVKPLYNYHVRRRKGRSRRLSSRIDKEPIRMMVDIMRAKQEVMKSIRGLVKLEDVPKHKKVQLEIVKPNWNEIKTAEMKRISIA